MNAQTMNLNDGNGLFDKYGLIKSMVDQLNQVEVKGYNNLSIIMDVGNKLLALRNGLMEEDRKKEPPKPENDEI